MSLGSAIANVWDRFQGELFPALADEVGPLNEKHRRFVVALDLVPVERFLCYGHHGAGRPPEDRRAIARAFIAKAVWNLPTTRDLIDRLHCDPTLRRLCGWPRVSAVPHESTFSRAFAAFAKERLPEVMHQWLVETAFADTIVGHISRDSTAITGREKPKAKPKPKKEKRRRGRPRKGEEVVREPTRLERQLNEAMSLDAMIADLPGECGVGVKKNAKGFRESWQGFKLHIDAADGDIPISCLLTSASVHDSQVSIPLARMSAARVAYCYELMDAAYDCAEIRAHAARTGHVAIIDINPRRNTDLKAALVQEARAQRVAGHIDPGRRRSAQRSSVERVNSMLKESYGGRTVRVRGSVKVACHLTLGILALTVDQLMRLAA